MIRKKFIWDFVWKISVGDLRPELSNNSGSVLHDYIVMLTTEGFGKLSSRRNSVTFTFQKCRDGYTTV